MNMHGLRLDPCQILSALAWIMLSHPRIPLAPIPDVDH